MPRLTTLGNVEIRIYFDDTRQHRQPHLHVASPDEEVLLSISGLSVLAGTLRQPALGEVVRWVMANMAQVTATWNRCNPQMPIRET